MINNPVVFLVFSCLVSWSGLYGQETYLLKIQPQAGTEYRFVSNVSISVSDGDDKPIMSTKMEQSIVTKITASSLEEVSLTEKIEKITGSGVSQEETFDFDTSKPIGGNPTMTAQMEQLVNKDVVSRLKPNGTFIAGNNPFEDLTGGQNNPSDFRTLTGNVRFPDYALKIGDYWTVVDTLDSQGMTTITQTVWTLQEVTGELAILVAKGTGRIVGSAAMGSDANVKGTMSSTGTAKIDLKTGISQEASRRVEAKVTIKLGGKKQGMTSVTEMVARQVN